MKIAILSSHTLSLFWFRLDLMKELIKHGHSVIAIGSEPEANWSAKFDHFKISYHYLPVSRNGINPFTDIKTIVALYGLLNRERPELILSYHSKTIIYGNIAGWLIGITEIYSIFTGLGSIFRGQGLKNRVLKEIMKMQYKVACSIAKRVFFQNPDDQNEFIRQKIVPSKKCHIINGSGVNVEHFKPVALPEQIAFLFIGRIIKDKGVVEYLEASRLVKKMYPNIRFILIGPFDTNPSSLHPSEIDKYKIDETIEYYGKQSDVRTYIGQSSVFVLPSYHEGTPKTVLEAMAMGRPIITTNTVGCKETVKDGLNGFLVPVRNINAIAEKMIWFINNPSFISSMGQESIRMCHEMFDVHKVNAQIIKHMQMGQKIIRKEKEAILSERL